MDLEPREPRRRRHRSRSPRRDETTRAERIERRRRRRAAKAAAAVAIQSYWRARAGATRRLRDENAGETSAGEHRDEDVFRAAKVNEVSDASRASQGAAAAAPSAGGGGGRHRGEALLYRASRRFGKQSWMITVVQGGAETAAEGAPLSAPVMTARELFSGAEQRLVIDAPAVLASKDIARRKQLVKALLEFVEVARAATPSRVSLPAPTLRPRSARRSCAQLNERGELSLPELGASSITPRTPTSETHFFGTPVSPAQRAATAATAVAAATAAARALAGSGGTALSEEQQRRLANALADQLTNPTADSPDKLATTGMSTLSSGDTLDHKPATATSLLTTQPPTADDATDDDWQSEQHFQSDDENGPEDYYIEPPRTPSARRSSPAASPRFAADSEATSPVRSSRFWMWLASAARLFAQKLRP